MNEERRICRAPSTSKWYSYRCGGYVKPGKLWCWTHDPEIQTPELKAKIRATVAAGRDRANRARSVHDQWCNWVGEGVPG